MSGSEWSIALIVPPLLAFTRATFIVVLLPFLGTKKTPSIVRMGLILTVALIIVQDDVFDISEIDLPTALFVEAITGAAIGMVARLLWELMLFPLALMDISLGRGSMGGTPITGDEIEGPLNTLGGLAFLAIYTSIAGHLDALRNIGFAHDWSPGDDKFGQFLASFHTIFELAFSIALPALFVALLVDLTLGWANRTLPSLPAMFIAMPLRSLIGWTLVPAVILTSFWCLDERGAGWFVSLLAL